MIQTSKDIWFGKDDILLREGEPMSVSIHIISNSNLSLREWFDASFSKSQYLSVAEVLINGNNTLKITGTGGSLDGGFEREIVYKRNNIIFELTALSKKLIDNQILSTFKFIK